MNIKTETAIKCGIGLFQELIKLIERREFNKAIQLLQSEIVLIRQNKISKFDIGFANTLIELSWLLTEIAPDEYINRIKKEINLLEQKLSQKTI